MKTLHLLFIVICCLIFQECWPIYLDSIINTESFHATARRANPVHCAAEAGDVTELQRLLASGVYFDFKDGNGLAPIHYAAKRGKTDCLVALLNHKVNEMFRVVNAHGAKGMRPLHYATYAGHEDCIKALLNANSPIDCEDAKGLTPVHYAARQGKFSCLKMLLDYDASKAPQLAMLNDKSMRTPLHCAMLGRNVDCIKLLLGYHASKWAEDENGLNPIHYAVWTNKVECLQTLLEGENSSTGAQNSSSSSFAMKREITCKDKKGLTPVHHAARDGKTDCLKLLLADNPVTASNVANLFDNEHKTALHHAAGRNRNETVEVLLKNGADPLAVDVDGKIPLHLVVSSPHDKYVECAGKLLQNKVQEQLASRDHEGNTPLHCVGSNRGGAGTRLLLSKGAKVFVVNNEGEDPLHKAAREGAILHPDHRNEAGLIASSKVTEALLEKYIRGTGYINAGNYQGKTPYALARAGNGGERIASLLKRKGGLETVSCLPLFRAVIYNDIEGVKRLIEKEDSEKKFPLKRRYAYQSTLLHYAALKGFLDVIALLLDKGSEINSQDGAGNTPLHYAAFTGHIEAIKLLLSRGAKIDVANKHERIALQELAKNSHDTCVQELLDLDTENLQRTFLFDKGYTALHLAVYRNNVKYIEALPKSMSSVREAVKNVISPLELALFCGYEQATRALLKRCDNINALNRDGHSLLQFASMHDQGSMIRILLESGASEDVPEQKSDSPIVLAATLGKIKSLEALLLGNEDKIDDLHNGQTLLSHAVQKNQPKVVEVLLKKGADPRIPSLQGVLPIEESVQQGFVEVTRVLLKSKAHLGIDGLYTEGLTLLHIAAKFGQKEIIQVLLENGANPGAVSSSGDDPLHCAAFYNRASVIETLAGRSGTFLDATNNEGYSPLEVAVIRGFTEPIIKMLIFANRRMYKTRNGRSLLHLAAKHDQVDVAKLLIEKGADVESESAEGFTPLEEAVRSGSVKVTRELLKLLRKPSDINIISMRSSYIINMRNSEKWTLLDLAEQNNHQEIIKMLTDSGAKRATQIENDDNGADQGVQLRIPSDSFDTPGKSPIERAVEYGHWQSFVGLLDTVNSSDINKIYDSGETLLHKAISAKNITIIKLLVAKGADVNALNKFGKTPLHRAVGEIVSYTVDTETQNNAAKLARWIAARKKSISIVRILLRLNADVNARYEYKVGNEVYKKTALHIAASTGDLEVLMLLLDYGADINVDDKDLNTPLHLAASAGHTDCVRVLVDRAKRTGGKCLDVKNRQKRTALHLAVMEGRESCVKELHRLGADLLLRGYDRKTPEVMALNFFANSADRENLSRSVRQEKAIKRALYGKIVDILQSDRTTIEPDAEVTRRVDMCREKIADGFTPVTPLEQAVVDGDLERVRKNLTTAEVNKKDRAGWMVLHIAARCGHTDIVELLLDQGAELEAKNGVGETALLLALRARQRGVVELIARKLIPDETKRKEFLAEIYPSSKHPSMAPQEVSRRAEKSNARPMALKTVISSKSSSTSSANASLAQISSNNNDDKQSNNNAAQQTSDVHSAPRSSSNDDDDDVPQIRQEPAEGASLMPLKLVQEQLLGEELRQEGGDLETEDVWEVPHDDVLSDEE